GVEVLAVEQHLPGDAGARHGLVHAIDAADERRLATPRGPDDRRYRVGRHGEIDAPQHEGLAEPRSQPLREDPVSHGHLSAPAPAGASPVWPPCWPRTRAQSAPARPPRPAGASRRRARWRTRRSAEAGPRSADRAPGARTGCRAP